MENIDQLINNHSQRLADIIFDEIIEDVVHIYDMDHNIVPHLNELVGQILCNDGLTNLIANGIYQELVNHQHQLDLAEQERRRQMSLGGTGRLKRKQKRKYQ